LTFNFCFFFIKKRQCKISFFSRKKNYTAAEALLASLDTRRSSFAEKRDANKLFERIPGKYVSTKTKAAVNRIKFDSLSKIDKLNEYCNKLQLLNSLSKTPSRSVACAQKLE